MAQNNAQKQDDIIVEGFGITAKVRFANSFENSKKELIEYDDAIIISTGKFELKVTAMQAAVLDKFFKDKDARAELQKRFVAEKTALQDVGF